jgi:hypothetical protein
MLVIVNTENNRVSKFCQFGNQEDAEAHVEKFGGVLYEGIYRPDLYIDNGNVSIVAIEKTEAEIKKEAQAKIDEIERNSLRAMREALLSDDKTALAVIDAEILVEREKLNKTKVK